MSGRILGTQDPVVLPAASLKSDNRKSAIGGNTQVVNALLAEYFEFDEISREALLSYRVAYYYYNSMNGGFSQFVYNSNWNTGLVNLVLDGLICIGAPQHAALFQRGAAMVENPAFALNHFLKSEFFGENEERDHLDALSDDFYALDAGGENIETLNDAWLRGRPNLVVLGADELAAYIAQKAASLPDREARKTRKRAAEPRYMKLIRAMCAAAEQSLDRLTIADPAYVHEGQKFVAWHFITDQGHHFLVDTGERALMFNGTTKEVILDLLI